MIQKIVFLSTVWTLQFPIEIHSSRKRLVTCQRFSRYWEGLGICIYLPLWVTLRTECMLFSTPPNGHSIGIMMLNLCNFPL